MNWYFSEIGGAINLSLVKNIRNDGENGWWAYFSLPTDGESWDECERVGLSDNDADDILVALKLLDSPKP